MVRRRYKRQKAKPRSLIYKKVVLAGVFTAQIAMKIIVFSHSNLQYQHDAQHLARCSKI